MELESLDFESKEVIRDIPPVVKEDKKEKKKPTLWERAFNTKKLSKPNVVGVLFLRNNGNAEPMHVESKKGFLTIYGKTYHEDRDCIYRLIIGKEKYPLAVIPEWSLIPFGTKQWQDKEKLEKFAELQDHVLRAIRHAEFVRMGETEGMGKMNIKAWILIAIVGIIGFAIAQPYIFGK